MKCPNCNTLVTEEDLFCPNCGFQLKNQKANTNTKNGDEIVKLELYEIKKEIDSIDEKLFSKKIAGILILFFEILSYVIFIALLLVVLYLFFLPETEILKKMDLYNKISYKDATEFFRFFLGVKIFLLWITLIILSVAAILTTARIQFNKSYKLSKIIRELKEKINELYLK